MPTKIATLAMVSLALILLVGPIAFGDDGPGVPGSFRAFAPVDDAVARRSEYQIVEIDYDVLAATRAEAACMFEQVPLGLLGEVDLMVQRIQILAPDAQVVVVDENGIERLMREGVATLWKGIVAGEPNSEVFLSDSPAGVFGWIRLGGERWIITSGDPLGDRTTVIYRASGLASQLIKWAPFECGSADMQPPPAPSTGSVGDEGGLAGELCVIVDVAIDTDNAYLDLFGGDEAAALGYIETLVAGTEIIFTRDLNIQFVLTFSRVWSGPDPWESDTTGDLAQARILRLNEFKDYWEEEMTSVSRDAAHLVGAEITGGGVAWREGVCTNLGYGLEAGINGYFPTPLEDNHAQNGDIKVFAHELGHTVGAIHTHEYCPPIDQCATRQYFGECQDERVCSDVGTIMSYCQSCTGGMSNIQLRFHPSVQETVREYVVTATCVFEDDCASLDADGDGVLTAWDNCPFQYNPDQSDGDGDGAGDVCDGCPEDPFKTNPGQCGCGVEDVDCLNDGVLYCEQTLYVPGDYATVSLALAAVQPCNATIEVAAGTWLIDSTIDLDGRAITIRGATNEDGTPATILDGQGTTRVLLCDSGETASTVLENLVIRNGLATDPDLGLGGGGLYIYESSPALINCTFANNTAVLGGGIFNDGGNPRVEGCVFDGNIALDKGGGMSNIDSWAFVSECAFRNNTAQAGAGGGMFNAGAGPSIGRCTFTENAAVSGDLSDGGGIFNQNSSPYLYECTFTGNTANRNGGGMCSTVGSGSSLWDCTFDDNFAGSSGGGLCTFDSETFVYTCRFTNNTAGNRGGGIRAFSTDVILYSSLLCGNAPEQISGDYSDGGGNCILESCTKSDSDNDGTPDCFDICDGHPDEEDEDQDGIPNGCDPDTVWTLEAGGDLQATIDQMSPGHTLVLESGTYEGPVTIDVAPITITGTGETVITAGRGESAIIISSSVDSDEVTLSGLIFISSGDGLAGSVVYGGGVRVESGLVVLSGCEIAFCSAQFGGGLYVGATASVHMTKSAIHHNDATSAGGGAYVAGGGNLYAEWTIFCSNTPEDIVGVWEDGGKNLFFESCPTIVPLDGDIQAAIDSAGDGETLLLAAGTYVPDETLELPYGRSITIQGSVDGDGVPLTILDGEQTRRLIDAASGSIATIKSCSFVNGATADDVFPGNCGGAIFVTKEAHLDVENCRFEDNFASCYGGAIFTWGVLNLRDSTFDDNSATLNGGAIQNQSPYDFGFVMTNCIVANNSAGYVGGLYSQGGSPVIENSTLCNNRPMQLSGPWTSSGGVCLSHSCDDSDGDGRPDCDSLGQDMDPMVPAEYATIEDAIDAAAEGATVVVAAGTYATSRTIEFLGKAITLQGEVDAGGTPITTLDAGGAHRVLAIGTGEDARTRLRNLVVSGGSADSMSWGGGLGVFYSSPAISNCIFTGNVARSGAGAFFLGESPTLTNCSFLGNSAGENGGGIASSCSSPTLTNCLFRDNSAVNGGGIWYVESDDAILQGTVVCSNTPSQIDGDYTDLGGNCIRESCGSDSDGNGIPDACQDADGVLEVPGEYATIELAISIAVDGDIVLISAGTYMPDFTLDPQGKSITVRGAVDGKGKPTTVIDGRDLITVLMCSNGEGLDTVFENLVITRGSHEYGGGMYNDGSSPTVYNCVFQYNSAAYGGGVFNQSADPAFTNCTFTFNHADVYGGGIYNYDSYSMATNCAFSSNSADIGSAGFNELGAPSLTDCSFTSNIGQGCGAFYNMQSAPDFTNCTFTSNVGDGGGVMFNDLSVLDVVNCTFLQNQALDGGAMINYRGDTQLTDCVFIENQAHYDGGALYNIENQVAMSNCVFDQNAATDGGGMYNYRTDSLLLNDCTLINNSASNDGGGMYNYGDSLALLSNTLVCENTPNQISPEDSYEDLGGSTVGDNCPGSCLADLDGNGLVDGGDLTTVLGDWGTASRQSDLNGDGFVDGADLTILLGDWGMCPEG